MHSYACQTDLFDIMYTKMSAMFATRALMSTSHRDQKRNFLLQYMMRLSIIQSIPFSSFHKQICIRSVWCTKKKKKKHVKWILLFMYAHILLLLLGFLSTVFDSLMMVIVLLLLLSLTILLYSHVQYILAFSPMLLVFFLSYFHSHEFELHVIYYA